MKLITSSGWGIASQCQYAFSDAAEWHERTSGSSAKMGSAFHDAADMWLKGQRKLVVADLLRAHGMRGTDKQQDTLNSLINQWLSWMSGRDTTGWRSELKIAFDPFSGVARVLPQTGHRDYSGAKPGEVAGTVDVIAHQDGSLSIIDWKTGLYAPANDAQMQFFALLGARLVGAKEAYVSKIFVYTDRVIESPIDGAYIITESELSLIQDNMVAVIANTDNGKVPVPVIGNHCTYCPARKTCSAQPPF